MYKQALTDIEKGALNSSKLDSKALNRISNKELLNYLGSFGLGAGVGWLLMPRKAKKLHKLLTALGSGTAAAGAMHWYLNGKSSDDPLLTRRQQMRIMEGDNYKQVYDRLQKAVGNDGAKAADPEIDKLVQDKLDSTRSADKAEEILRLKRDANASLTPDWLKKRHLIAAGISGGAGAGIGGYMGNNMSNSVRQALNTQALYKQLLTNTKLTGKISLDQATQAIKNGFAFGMSLKDAMNLRTAAQALGITPEMLSNPQFTRSVGPLGDFNEGVTDILKNRAKRSYRFKTGATGFTGGTLLGYGASLGAELFNKALKISKAKNALRKMR